MTIHTEPTREQAERFLESYCIDPAPEGAVDRLLASRESNINQKGE